MYKFLSALLAAVILIVCLPVQALAEYDASDDVVELYTEEPGIVMDVGNKTPFVSIEDAVEYVRDHAESEWPDKMIVNIYPEAFDNADIASAWNTLRYAFTKNLGDYPDGDWLWHYGISDDNNSGSERYTLTITDNISNEQVKVYRLVYLTPVNKKNIEALDNEIKDFVEDLVPEDYTDFEKIKAVYDWVTSNVKYHSGEARRIDQTPYGAFKNREAICAGYGLLVYRMLYHMGVECRYVSGLGTEGDNCYHGWNLVGLDGKYYWLDATWDAGKERYDCFLAGNDSFIGDGEHHIVKQGYASKEFTSRYPTEDEDYLLPGEAGFKSAVSKNSFSFFKAYFHDEVVSLSWSPVEGATGYSLSFRSSHDGKWHDQSSRTDNSTAYTVRRDYDAVKIFTDNGVQSEIIEIPEGEGKFENETVYASHMPGTPLITVCRVEKSGTVYLRWACSSDAESYKIYMSDDGSDVYRKIGETESNEFIATGLKSANVCRFIIRSYNGEWSEAESCRPASVTPVRVD